MQEDFIPHYEIYHNRRWSLIEAEKALEKNIALLLIYSQREILHVGLNTIRNKFDKFSKIQQALGNKILLRASLSSYNKNIALIYDCVQKQKATESFIPLSQCAPIQSLTDYIETALNILQIFFVIHKHSALHNCVNINAFVCPVGDLNNVQLLDMGDMMDCNSINQGTEYGMSHSSKHADALLLAPLTDSASSEDNDSITADNNSNATDNSNSNSNNSNTNSIGTTGTFGTSATSGSFVGGGGGGGNNNSRKKKVSKEYLEELVDYRYASPEHTGRIEGRIDRRSDLYTLGVLLYELAAGAVPFTDNDGATYRFNQHGKHEAGAAYKPEMANYRSETDVLSVLHKHMTMPPPPLPSGLWPNRPDVRVKMAEILHKMLSKAPNGRYQSLYGVIRDLEYLKQAIATDTDVSTFTIATHDLEDEFSLGSKDSLMYGREEQKKQLRNFLNDFDDYNQTSLISIRGHSGVGKSTFVQYVFEQLHHRRDNKVILLSGKHDRLKQTPYGVLVELVSYLVRRLLALSPHEIDEWSRNINDAVSPNGQVLLDFLPEMVGVIGPQGNIPVLPPVETRQRFERVFVSFCQVFFSSYSVVLFLDDVQWADPATLTLLESLLTNSSIKNFLCVLAFRDTEIIQENETLIKLLANVRKREGTKNSEIVLGDLDLQDVQCIVRDCFKCNDNEKSTLLASLLFSKTRGNPFFLCQLLRSITADRHVVYNYTSHEWEWNIEQISAVQFTENVIDFLVEQIKKLPKEAREVAQTASCLGTRFDASVIVEILTEKVFLCNLPLLISNGFIQPQAEVVKVAHHEITCLRFVHDRIQEAFYAIMDPEERKQTHLKVARLKKERYGRESQAFARSKTPPTLKRISSYDLFYNAIVQDMLFTVAHHYNAAAELVAELDEESPERKDVMLINIEAATRAKRSSAVEAARTYLRYAHKAMSSKLHNNDYSTWFTLHHFLAECEAICGELVKADALFEVMLEGARNNRDRVRVYILKINAHFSMGSLNASIDAAKAALRLNAIELPSASSPEVLNSLVDEVLQIANAKCGDNFMALADMETADEDTQLAIETLHSTIPIAFTLVTTPTDITFFHIIMALICKLSFSRGMTVHSASGIACFSSYLCQLKRKESYGFGLLAMRLQEVRPNPVTAARTGVNFMGFAQWQRESAQACRTTVLTAYKSGLDVGDTLYTLYSSLLFVSSCLMLDHIEDSEPLYQQMLTTLRGAKSLHPSYVDSVFAIHRSLGLLKGSTLVDGEFDDFDPLDHYDTLTKMKAPFFIAAPFYAVVTTYIVLEDYEKALELDEKMPLHVVSNSLLYFDYISWSLLLHLAILPAPTKEETEEKLQILSKRFEELDFVKHSPCLRAQITLVKAEMARVKGELAKAMLLYNKSIERAKIIPSQRLIGYANERAMKFYLQQKKEKQATIHFREARSAYFAWGAYLKTRKLELKYNPLAGHVARGSLSLSHSTADHAPPQPEHLPQQRTIDLSSVIQACQVLSSEMDFSKLLHNLVRIVIQNTGAQRAFFILPEENTNRLFIEVQGDSTGKFQILHTSLTPSLSPPVSPRGVVAIPNPLFKNTFSPLKHSTSDSDIRTNTKEKDKSAEDEKKERSVDTNDIPTPAPSSPTFSSTSPLPAGIVQYVYKTKSPVLLSDAVQEGIFAFEQHVQQNNTKSVLCVPALYQSRVVAIIYLENNLMSGAFTAERLEVVQMLSTQIAISFVNSRLYADLQNANKQLAHKNKSLIEFDQIKDQFLANTSHELRTPLNGIIGLAESLVDTGIDPANAANTISTLGMIINCGKRLANLVNDILDYNSLRIGTFNVHPRPTDLTPNIAEVVSVSQPLIGSKPIELVNKVQQLPILRVDPSRIQQVLQNIIGNAIKFTEAGKVVIDSEVTNDWITIIISDTGCGIPESQNNIIFEEFKQVDGSISREVGGTGLGLPISKKLIELHNGNIFFESQVGKGSTFRVCLPNTSKKESPPPNIRSAIPTVAPRSAYSPTVALAAVISPPINRVHISPSHFSAVPRAKSPLSIPNPTSLTNPNTTSSSSSTGVTQSSTVPSTSPVPVSTSPIPTTPPTTSPKLESSPASDKSTSSSESPTNVVPVVSTTTVPLLASIPITPNIALPTLSFPPPLAFDNPLPPPSLTNDEGNPIFTVLSVDDEASNQIVIKKLLGKKFKIVTSMSGQDALNKVNDGLLPDIILLDVMMPKLSGLDVCEIIRKKYPVHQLPIIMVSARNKPADIVAGLVKGANDYVGKPINKDELLARMTTQLTMCLSFRSQPTATLSCKNCTKIEDDKDDQFMFAPHHLAGVLDLLPFAFTIYDLDAKIILRNKMATDIFNTLGGPPDTQNNFMPHAKYRHHANEIFSSAKDSEEVDKTIPVAYGDKELEHRISARIVVVINEKNNAKVPFILVTEQPNQEPAPQNAGNEKDPPAKPAVQMNNQTTQTQPITPQKATSTSSSSQTTPQVTPITPRAISPRATSPIPIRPRSTSPRGNSANPSPSSPRKINLSIVPPTAVPPTSSIRSSAQTSPRNVISPLRPSSSASNLSITSTSTTTSGPTPTPTPPTPTPTPGPGPTPTITPTPAEPTNILNMEQMLDYVDTLHDYIGDLEKEKRARGEFVPNVVRSASLPSAFKQRSNSISRPPLTNSLARNTTIPKYPVSSSQNIPPVRSSTADLPPYVIPSSNPPFFLPTPIPSPRIDLTASQESTNYFTRSSYTTPTGTPLSTSRSVSSDLPYFTLSSYSSMDSIPDALLHSRFLNRSTSIPQIPPEMISTTPSALTPSSAIGPDPRMIRMEIHDLQAQIYMRQAQLASFLRIRFRITALPNKERRFSLDPTKDSREPNKDINRERNNLLARFYSTLELPEANVRMLYNEVAHRLEVPVDAILALVKNGDTLVTVDEDVEDGLAVDVFLDEQM